VVVPLLEQGEGAREGNAGHREMRRTEGDKEWGRARAGQGATAPGASVLQPSLGRRAAVDLRYPVAWTSMVVVVG
jgi:hypothetical protein